MSSAERTARTYRAEKWRAVFTGILETAQATFLLLIAVRWHHAGPTAKGLLVAGQSIGLLSGPLVVNVTQRLQCATSRAAAALVAIGAAGMAWALCDTRLVAFVGGSMIATFSAAAIVPLMTQVFHENYPASARGKLFSRAFAVRIAMAIAFSYTGGWLLARDLAWHRGLLAIFTFALIGACWSLACIPSRPLAPSASSHPLRALRHVREDRLFRQLLISWMLMGFGNLITLPLRIEYLANPAHGISLHPDTIALVTGVVPNLARLIITPLCGIAFDRMNFFTLRATLNFGFAISILAFFTSNTLPGLILGAIIYGISVGGGDVAWALWVTKLAPSHSVADYMSIHASLTGVRGIIAPLVAFHAITHYSLVTVGWGCIALILLGNATLLPEILASRKLQPAAGPMEDLPE
jgi:MFS family permease